jgi:hypothetical protein
MSDFLQSLNDLISKQLQKLTEEEEKALEKSNLTAVDIDKRITKELIRVCTERYEEPISNRLDGFGWSKQRIQEHMKRYLREILFEVYQILSGIERSTTTTLTSIRDELNER